VNTKAIRHAESAEIQSEAKLYAVVFIPGFGLREHSLE